MGGYLTGVSPGLRELVTPTVDVYADGVGFNDGSSTSVTLSTDPGSENNIIVTFDGVTQHHDTYSVSGTTLSFDAAVPTGTAKIECRYASEHPAYTGVADGAVTNAKTNFTSSSSAAGLQIKGDGTTDGMLQLNCSQNTHGIKLKSPPHSATADYTLTFPNDDGDANEVLKTNGSGVLTWGAGGTGYEFVSVVTANNSAATVAFTNHVSGYDYQYRWSNLTPATNDSTWRAQLGTSGPTYITSGYLGTSFEVNSAASSTAYEYTGYMSIGANAYDGTEPDSAAGLWNVFDPAGSGVTKIMGQNVHRNSGHTFYNGLDFYYNSTAASHTAIKFYFAAGNVEAGVIVQYRRKLSA